MAGGGEGLLVGLLQGLGGGLIEHRKQQQEQELLEQRTNQQIEAEGRRTLLQTALKAFGEGPPTQERWDAMAPGIAELIRGAIPEGQKGQRGQKGQGGMANITGALREPGNLGGFLGGLRQMFPTQAQYDQQQEAEARNKLELDIEKYERTTGTKSPSERAYNPLSEIVDRTVKEREADGHKVGADEYRQIVLEAQQGLTGAKAKPPNATVVDRQRVTRAQRLKLINPNLTDDQADVMAARLIEGENKQKLDASLAKSYDVIARDKETLALLKETAPLTVLAKQLGIETAEDRLDNKKAAGSKDPAAILQAARKYAHKVAADAEKNRSLFSKIFGDTPPTEDELTDKFIAEWTNENPEDVRTQAAAVRKPPTGKTKPASAGLTNPFK